MSILFFKAQLGPLTLQNHLVIAPMTRSRATDNVPNDLMVEYYAQRGSAGLIVTEGTSPSPNGLGYARIPGIFSDAQVAGWKKITDAVHARGARIFLQLMHTGRSRTRSICRRVPRSWRRPRLPPRARCIPTQKA